jgi:hypothetical protein
MVMDLGVLISSLSPWLTVDYGPNKAKVFDFSNG